MKILIVDDSLTIRKVIKEELEGGGYEVLVAEDGILALAQLKSYRTLPDLITLDIDMPHLNGLETCKRLKTDHLTKGLSNIPIMFVTGNDNLKDRSTGFELGAADFISKPFPKGEILAAVNKILHPNTQLINLTALVVDDSVTARKMITNILEREGLNIIEAENGLQAYEIMCNHMGKIDLLIVDFMMPEMNGDELCLKIRQELNLIDLPIIFLTGISEQSQLLKIFKSGGTDYLIKPFVKEELLARLRVHFERNQLNKRLKETVIELRGLNKMKDNLLAVCSHDLKSPLNGILGISEIMIENAGLSDENRENLDDIIQSGHFLLGLVNDILDLSKIQSDERDPEMENLILSDLAKNSFNAMKHMAINKRQSIKFIDNCNREKVNVNRLGLIRVINNLLSNAIKFTEPEGEIKLRIEPSPAGRNVSIIISDSGIGIPESKLKHLFDKFTIISQSGTSGEKGTGLGMSIVKETIDKHGGAVHVKSKKGKGSHFEIILPLAENMDSPLRKPDKIAVKDRDKDKDKDKDKVRVISNKKGNKNFYNVLVADDNKINLKIARIILIKGGHRVSFAVNGKEAVNMVQSGKFDIILMDLQMPEMSGIEATIKIRESGSSMMPIIALTSHDDKETIEKCLAAGMNDFITKPFRTKDLESIISKWC